MPTVNSVDGEKLKSFVERIERINEEVDGLKADSKEIYGEAKSAGFDTGILRKLIAERRRDKNDLDEEMSVLEVYRRALGDYVSTPLGASAMERAAG